MQKFIACLAVAAFAAVALTGCCNQKMGEEKPKLTEEEMMALGMPGPEHAQLAKMAGEYDTVMTGMYEGQPFEHKGTARREMLWDRYLVEKSVCRVDMGPESPAMEMHGMNVIGFDNETKEWQSSYISNMHTSQGVGTGKMDEKTNTITYTGSMGSWKYKYTVMHGTDGSEIHKLFDLNGKEPELVFTTTYTKKRR